MKALTYVAIGDKRWAPGQSVTKADLKEAGQTEEDIAQLVKDGALSEDPNTPIHKDHADVEIEYTGAPEAVRVVSQDGGTGVDQNR